MSASAMPQLGSRARNELSSACVKGAENVIAPRWNLIASRWNLIASRWNLIASRVSSTIGFRSFLFFWHRFYDSPVPRGQGVIISFYEILACACGWDSVTWVSLEQMTVSDPIRTAMLAAWFVVGAVWSSCLSLYRELFKPFFVC